MTAAREPQRAPARPPRRARRSRGTPVLRTPRLTLRRRVPADAAALFATMADAQAMLWWSRPPVASVAELRDHFTGDDPDWRSWAVTRTGDDRAIGFVAVGAQRQGGVSEIGYLFDRDVWGTGIAREGVAAVVTQMFAEGHRRIYADTDPDNTASVGLLERLGFTLEGRLRAEWETPLGFRDTLIFGLLEDEWHG